MEILISIGIFALGVVIGAVVMACMATAGYADTLQDTYDRGYEDGRKEEHQKWLMSETHH